MDALTLDSWITSDHHWGHDNIVRFQGRPADHEMRMSHAWTERVEPDDVVLHLGDLVCFEYRREEPARYWGNLIASLPGNKYLLKGNHDKHANAWYEAAGWTVLGRKSFRWHRPDTGASILFSHEPDAGLGYSTNVHGHIHGNPLFEHLRGSDRRNVCVEVTDYAPVRLRAVLDSPA